MTWMELPVKKWMRGRILFKNLTSTYKEIKSLPRMKIKNARTFHLTDKERENAMNTIKKKRAEKNKLKVKQLEEKMKMLEKLLSSLN